MERQIVINHLNQVGLPACGVARVNIPGTDQRSSAIFASTVDLEEAYRSGMKAAQIAAEDGNGYMSTILREPGPIYQVKYDKVPLEQVANSERSFPQEWIAQSRTDVTDDFIAYARPLIGDTWPNIPLVDGIQRFTRFETVFAKPILKKYTFVNNP